LKRKRRGFKRHSWGKPYGFQKCGIYPGILANAVTELVRIYDSLNDTIVGLMEEDEKADLGDMTRRK
jgi:hypothetical protein